ncbi:hypothetical protein EIP86_008047 [Pleurotus ostreatoroseus]|nr:hypothetical protein EIP86_008047 [Pleurotus ostreatoroseus]
MGRPKQPWRASPDPEVFEDADAEWEVDRIVSDEIDLFGRRWLEIKWGQWERADGTNTTFQEDLENERVVRDWERKRRDARNELAAETLAVDIQGPEVPDHFYRTFEVASALEEKLSKSQASVDSRYSSWETLRHLGSSTWRSDTSSLRSSSRSKDSVPRSYSSASKRPLVPSRSSASTDERPSKIPKTTPVSVRKILLHSWLHECRQAGAPGVRIYNDVDDEEIPPIDPRFNYLENSYDFGNIRLIGSDEEWLAGCGDEDDEPTPAYKRVSSRSNWIAAI